MRASFAYVVIGTFALGALGVFAAHGQSVKPKSPGEITKASAHIAQRNEDLQASGARAAFASPQPLSLHARLQTTMSDGLLAVHGSA